MVKPKTRRNKTKTRKNKNTKTKIDRISYNDKYIIIRDDNDGNHLRRPIYSEYIKKIGDKINVLISEDSLLHENSNLEVDYKNNKLSDKISKHKYNFNCTTNKKNVYVTIDEKYNIENITIDEILKIVSDKNGTKSFKK